MELKNVNKIELHYYFGDNSHSINAFVRHRCENEILTIIKDLANSLGVETEVLREPDIEGGFKEFWKFIGKNNVQLTFLATIIALILSRIPLSNTELERIQKENLLLDNEEKKLNIEKLKKEFNKIKEDDTTFLDHAVNLFDSDYKVIKHKSNFYYALQAYPDVKQIATVTHFDKHQVGKEHIVKREDFHKFILSTNELPPINVENAIVEIISPVLKNGKYKWKGVYEGKVIDFMMKDEEYRKSVIKGEITFKSGFYLEVVLVIKREIDDFGIIQHTGYIVTKILGRIVDNKIIETEQGKRYRKIKGDLDNQTEISF